MNINLDNKAIISILPNLPNGVTLSQFQKVSNPNYKKLSKVCIPNTYNSSFKDFVDINTSGENIDIQNTEAEIQYSQKYGLYDFIFTQYYYKDENTNIEYYIEYTDFSDLDSLSIKENSFINPSIHLLSSTIKNQISLDTQNNKQIKVCNIYNLLYNIRRYYEYLLYEFEMYYTWRVGIILDFSKITYLFPKNVYKYYQTAYNFIIKFLYQTLSNEDINNYVKYSRNPYLTSNLKKDRYVYNYFENVNKTFNIYQLKIIDNGNTNLRNYPYRTINIYDSLIDKINDFIKSNKLSIHGRSLEENIVNSRDLDDFFIRSLKFQKISQTNDIIIYIGKYSPNIYTKELSFTVKLNIFSDKTINIMINSFTIMESLPSSEYENILLEDINNKINYLIQRSQIINIQNLDNIFTQLNFYRNNLKTKFSNKLIVYYTEYSPNINLEINIHTKTTQEKSIEINTIDISYEKYLLIDIPKLDTLQGKNKNLYTSI